jgi:hypothetical protein
MTTEIYDICLRQLPLEVHSRANELDSRLHASHTCRSAELSQSEARKTVQERLASILSPLTTRNTKGSSSVSLPTLSLSALTWLWGGLYNTAHVRLYYNIAYPLLGAQAHLGPSFCPLNASIRVEPGNALVVAGASAPRSDSTWRSCCHQNTSTPNKGSAIVLDLPSVFYDRWTLIPMLRRQLPVDSQGKRSRPLMRPSMRPLTLM